MGTSLTGVSNPQGLQARLDEGETALPYAVATCAYCQQDIYPVIVWSSGLIDWEVDGDSGCEMSPETNAEGTGGHVPLDKG